MRTLWMITVLSVSSALASCESEKIPYPPQREAAGGGGAGATGAGGLGGGGADTAEDVPTNSVSSSVSSSSGASTQWSSLAGGACGTQNCSGGMDGNCSCFGTCEGKFLKAQCPGGGKPCSCSVDSVEVGTCDPEAEQTCDFAAMCCSRFF
jgi:hypothetical protein